MIADAEAVNGRKNFIIVIVKDKFQNKELPEKLRTYLGNYTYIDATKSLDRLSERLRWVKILTECCTAVYEPTQDRGPFWFSYILNEILQYIEIWNEFKV